MKHLLTLGLLLLLSTTTMLSQDSWVKVIGGSGNDNGTSIDRTLDGGFIVLGTTSSNDLDFQLMNRGKSDICVIKLDSNGNVVWKKTYGGSDWDVGTSIKSTRDGDFLLTGHTESNDYDFTGLNKGRRDVFVMKLDSKGRVNFIKLFGGSGYEWGNDITLTPDDGFVVCGTTTSNDGDFGEMMNLIDTNYYDIIVMKMNSIGNVVWKRKLGGTDRDGSSSITTSTNGDVILVGSTESRDGDFEDPSGWGGAVVVLKLSNDGIIVWKKLIGGSVEDYGYSIRSTKDGGCVLSGTSNSNDRDFEGMNPGPYRVRQFWSRLDSRGNVLQLKMVNGSGNYISSINTTVDDNLIMMGKGDPGLYVRKMDMLGSMIWHQTISGSRLGEVGSVISTPDGGIVITGTCSVYGGSGVFTGMMKGLLDIFVMKLDSNGNYTPSTSVRDQTITSTRPLHVSPNPLSTSSTITYTLDTPSIVRIELMNTLGQVVDVVFDGYRDLGTHGLPLNVSLLTSGMYSFRMTSDNVVYTTQVCVVK